MLFRLGVGMAVRIQDVRQTDIDTLSFHTKKPDYMSNFPHYL